MLARQFDALLAAVRGPVPATRVGDTSDRRGADDGEHGARGGSDESGDGHAAGGSADTGQTHAAAAQTHADTADADAAGESAHGGVAFDGLAVWETDAGFGFRTPETEATALDREELRRVADDSPYVTNWYFWEWEVRRHGRPKRAFLRRAEAANDHAPPERYDALADGLVTEWGQLRIEVTVGEHGTRQYEIRHTDEADVDRESLTAYHDPLDARDIAETDADGRYRPLKTAPSLDGGWVFPSLDWRDAVATVEEFYPATVANWYREQTGSLDVDHWRDTAERQTGIYDIVEELDPEAVDRIAATACDDSQCLKRREWQYDEETALAADGGTGTFPCREPCSLVVAAARKWTTLEREEERTYEFTLTPSEKEQVEALIETVAEGRVGEIREADVYEGANRYRTRYLREKRMIDGDLCGVPTDPDESHGEHDDDHGDHADDDHGDHGDEAGHENHTDDDHGDGEGHEADDGDHSVDGHESEHGHDDRAGDEAEDGSQASH